MRLFCFIQCRSDSTRFPGKCFEEIGGKSIIENCYDGCVANIQNTAVLIPIDDIPLEKFLIEKNMPYFKGPKDDVLKRYVNAAIAYRATHIIRITGDCPFPNEPGIVYVKEGLIKNSRFFNGEYFISNCFPPRRIVDGHDVEGFNIDALIKADEYTIKNREHVTSILYEDEFCALTESFADISVDLSMHKTSIDTPEDLERVRKMVK